MIAVITLREDLTTYLSSLPVRETDERRILQFRTSRRAAKFYVNAEYLNTSERGTREAHWEILG